ncbi:N-6 DNA methylase [Campylobacter sp. MIT 21-1685]|uniref:restriction endonuclease subunit M n=1 Tax=unclassified Campylobacter TaxID=2593542 RepID=UPI00224B62FB|nr:MULTISPECIES: N-6 DNA methylase [unclassified Campylobacter]MCX2683440.1 N-6 DNA methylase [Campylobacter sp. MIT 21-1684]MCX2751738.1 N-6 DNA methylase [Campylobacter sp. MIT 21-1682]MCX2807940.1 N-6 DNA methylase [Campylobacter sp. MIT 21-1685]
MQDLINEGINKGLISFDQNKETITYIHQNKKRKYSNPEEQVQALSFLKLILHYNYPVECIKQFEPVKMGSSTKEADIIVFNDKQCQSPYIIVECKRQDISDLEFKSAVEQAFSYAVSELASYIWVSSGLKDEYYEVPKERPRQRIPIPNIPRYGSKEILEYNFVAGGEREGKKYFDLQEIEQSQLTQVFKQAHNALWGGGELNPSTAFDELDKLIFCKIWDEKNTPDGEPYKFQIYTIKQNNKEESNIQDIMNRQLMARIQELYEEGRKKDPEVFKEDIRLSPEKIRAVVGYLEKINLSKTDLDVKGRAFETFMGSFFRGDFGQYFTPREIVKFIVDVLPITNDSFVLDTSCGSGGFLLRALDKVRKQACNKFGISEEDIRLYKHYKNDLANFMQNNSYDKETKDRVAKVAKLYEHWKRFWHDFAQNNLFGIEINEQIARVAKMNMIIHDDGHTNVIAYDGLAPIDENSIEDSKGQQELKERLKKLTIDKQNNNFKSNHFDFIITNPPFGSTIKQTEKAYLHQYNFGNSEISWLDLRPYRKEKGKENQSTEILFMEQAHNFLKDKGILAIVIPDGILTNSSLQYVRDSLEELYRIVAVISMPQTAFSHKGAGVKSSVLFLQKYNPKQTQAIKDFKEKLQNKLKKSEKYEEQMLDFEKIKRQEMKTLDTKYPNKADKETTEYKEAKANINALYKEKVECLQSKMQEFYQEQKSKLFEEEGLDYEIFMAIAENIGYDATGKPTGKNELDDITKELERFIKVLV